MNATLPRRSDDPGSFALPVIPTDLVSVIPADLVSVIPADLVSVIPAQAGIHSPGYTGHYKQTSQRMIYD